MNIYAIRVIYKYEMKRAFNTIAQSFASPVLSTVLYFVVFGTAIGSRIDVIEEVSYGLFIVPGLMMLTILSQSLANASFGIYFPRFTGQIYEVLSAPVSFVEIVIGYVGAAATKALLIAFIILFTASFFCRDAYRPSALDAGLFDPDLCFLQPVWFYYWPVGKGL